MSMFIHVAAAQPFTSSCRVNAFSWGNICAWSYILLSSSMPYCLLSEAVPSLQIVQSWIFISHPTATQHSPPSSVNSLFLKKNFFNQITSGNLTISLYYIDIILLHDIFQEPDRIHKYSLVVCRRGSSRYATLSIQVCSFFFAKEETQNKIKKILRWWFNI